MIYLFLSQRCLTLSCVCACVFLSPWTLPLSYLPVKSLLYISAKPICGIDGFFLTFVLTLLSASISIYYPCVSPSPLQHNRSIIGGWWHAVGLKALTGVAVRCCFWGSIWTRTSKTEHFCEAPSCSSSQQPRVGSLHDASRRLALSLLPPPFSSSLSVSPPPLSSHPWQGKCPCLLLYHYLS